MTTRRELIMSEIQTLLEPLVPDTVRSVSRFRLYPYEAGFELPSINIVQGSCELRGDEGEQAGLLVDDWALTVTIELRARDVDAVDAVLNELEGEVHAALFADSQLGLGSFVHEIRPSTVSAPEFDPDLREEIAQLNTEVIVFFRTARTVVTN